MQDPDLQPWSFAIEGSDGDARTLRLSGELSGELYEIVLRELPRSHFELTGRGFHWVDEFPRNR